MLVALVNKQPRLTPHSLDLLQAIEQQEPGSQLVLDVLEDLGKQLLNRTSDTVAGDMQYHLALLQYAVQYRAVDSHVSTSIAHLTNNMSNLNLFLNVS